MVSVKSGWDEYGISYGRPSSDITVRRITGSSPFAGVAIGSETSGGVKNVVFENITLSDMGIAIHLKTNTGRGGYIRNVTVSGVSIDGAIKGLRVAGDVGDHPDDGYDPTAVPDVDGVTVRDVYGERIQQPGSFQGIKAAPFTRICLSNVKLFWAKKEVAWKCADVTGGAVAVQPWPCPDLSGTDAAGFCAGSF